MKPSLEKLKINGVLKRAGFAGLYEAALLPQMALLFDTPEKFRKLLTTVEPDKRKEAYDALRPHLSFPVEPLDVYISQARAEAQRLRLPLYDHETGQIHEHDHVDAAPIIQKAAAEAYEKHSLVLTCVKCTRQEEFKAWMESAAERQARNMGWVNDGPGREICPKCPAVRVN